MISLREDVLRARAYCEAPVANLLASSDSVLGQVDQMGESVNAWLVTGCPDPDQACLLLDTRPDLVIAGRNASRVADAPVSASARTGVLVQDVPVGSAGLYVLSWVDKFVGTTDGVRDVGVPAAVPYRVTLERAGSNETVSEVDAPGDALNAPELHELVLDVTQAGVLRVTIDPGESSEAKGDAWFAELQLERILPNLDPVRSGYVPTTSGGMARLEVCADVDGSVMRERFFQHRYERLCSGGIEQGCGDRDERVQSNPGFWEIGFAIVLDQIERGELIPSGAIALGNYNYRHDLVGVNLVGANVRDCSASQEPSSCYSNAFIPVSLIHAGEARIRNHTGDDVAFDFGRGSIEHGKALASEVVLTNPLTGAMETLLQPYYKEEFRGRPLTGEYWLRIWDDPALNWNNVEDVQLVFRYRYWTRFGE